MTNWKDIHSHFGSYSGEEKKEEWLAAGFNYQTTKEWINFGLKVGQSEIAAYAKWKDYQSSSINAAELRKEYYKAQNWLDYYYPLKGKAKNNEFLKPNQEKIRSKIKKLIINEKKLEGSLSLEGFVNLEEFYCRGNKITSLKLGACPNLRVFSCVKNELTHLDLTGLNKLTKLYCSNNQLINLKLHDCANLQKFDCVNNSLINTEFLVQLPQPQKLEELDISDNDFASQDLTFLTTFVNLRQLFLGSNDQKRIKKGLCNRFFGSLQPLQKLNKLEEVNIDSNSLEGSLKLENFTNLENFSCINNQINNLDFSDCSRLKKNNCYNNQLTSLDISKNVYLTSLVCSNNQLTGLKLGKNSQLAEIFCWGNYLVDLDLSSLNPEKLERLDISNNNFPEQDLSLFSKFVNLKRLVIGTNDEERIEKDIYNRFIGTLKPLKDMNKLEELDISNTDINQGVDFLPNSITEIYYSTEERSESKLKDVSEGLKWWEKIDHSFVPEVKKEWEDRGFDCEETKEWIDIGLKAKDAGYAQWLRDIKKKDAEWVLNEGDEQNLREEYKKKELQTNIQVSPYQKK